jgi:outer membrane protein TolC
MNMRPEIPPIPGPGILLASLVLLAFTLQPAVAQSSGLEGPPRTASSDDSSAPAVTPLSMQQDFNGSVPEGKAIPEIISISLSDALQRGLRQNLGALLASDSTLSARGQRWKELSELLPNVSAKVSENAQQQSLAAFGFTIPGLPRVIGPFNYFDARAYWTQTLFNYQYIEKERASVQNLKAAEHNYHDARELVVLAVSNAYLQALAGAARVETTEAQVDTAQALFSKATDQQKAGVTPAIDTLRSQVELQTRQQQLIVARNSYAKQKLALARVIGLPLGQEFRLSDRNPYEPLTTAGLEESLRRAYTARQDYQAVLAQLRAAELSRRAATSEHYPSLDMEADYGAIGVNPATSNGTFHVAGNLNIPIFVGGRAHADVLKAEAMLRQTRSQVEDFRGRIDNEVRTALLDLASADEQVQVARSSVDLAQQTLVQAQDRFAAGVSDNLEVIQAQEAVASANENYISSLYAHNIAKVSYARAIGYAEEGVKQYLKGH